MRMHIMKVLLLGAAAFGSFFGLQANPAMTWTGTISSANNVTDCNLILDGGTITIDGGVHVHAATSDILVTMTTADVILQGDATGPSRLYLETDFGRTMTVCLNNDLRFQGSSGGTDLLVLVSGEGTVEFQIPGGNKLTLGTNDVAGGATQMFVLMNEFVEVGQPSGIVFRRKVGESVAQQDMNAEVCLEERSLLSYLAENPPATSDEYGFITFDATNDTARSGRLVLTLLNNSSFVTFGHQVDDATNPEILLSDINLSILTGHFAGTYVISNDPTGFAGLLVQNYNEEWPELLIDPFYYLGARDDNTDWNGLFSGFQPGFIVGANGALIVSDQAYLDYVGLTSTVCPTQTVASRDFCSDIQESLLKARTPSALIVDGSHDPDAAPAIFYLRNADLTGGTSGIFFRSGVDVEGHIRDLSDPHPFTIDPQLRAPGAGYSVLSVEGPLNVYGSNEGVPTDCSTELLHSKIEILSLEVDPVGGPLFPNQAEVNFPIRTFATDGNGDPYQYNAANFFINNDVRFGLAVLEHTDTIHKVFEENDTESEPAYIGGDTAVLRDLQKPRWIFLQSELHLHESVAFTGFDLFVSSSFFDPVDGQDPLFCLSNRVNFKFFQNGKVVDSGTGRNMILGTYIGSTACDGCTIVCRDAHLDVMQECACVDFVQTQSLVLMTCPNYPSINNLVPDTDISTQYDVQTIFLGNNSNISIGTNGSVGTKPDSSTFPLTTLPSLLIDGNYFSFETRGGINGLPEAANITGQGGIFVDMNGTIGIASTRRASMSTMVTKSRNGVINLPENQVLFGDRVGIAQWDLDLSDANQLVVVASDQNLSDYTLNWLFVNRDYENFSPYEVDSYNVCVCPPVQEENISSIPVVQGRVDQFQIKGSRLGDQAHIKVDGGSIRELIFLGGFNSAEAPVGVVVLQGWGRVGLNTLHTNNDSVEAEIKLGVNGVTIIANGDGIVEVNDDLCIDNICSILAGPNFGQESENVLRFHSTCCKTIRVKPTGILDLRSMTNQNQVVEFSGNVKVVLEPGARIIMGGDEQNEGGIIRFVDGACLIAQPVKDVTAVFGQNPTALSITDDVRVRLIGRGRLRFEDCACFTARDGAFIGVETLEQCGIDYTDIILELRDTARFTLGSDRCFEEGGSFQVGNTYNHVDSSVSFELLLNGAKTVAEVSSRGFLGTGVGIVKKLYEPASNWLVAPTYNVANVSFNLANGTFRHNHIASTSSNLAGIFAISESATEGADYTFNVDPIVDVTNDDSEESKTNIVGGGNFINVQSSATAFAPVVNEDDGVIDANYSAGLVSSMAMIQPPFAGSTADQLFTFWKAQEVEQDTPVDGRAAAGLSPDNNKIVVGYIDGGKIGRQTIQRIIGSGGGTTTEQSQTLAIGCIGIALVQTGAAPRAISYAVEIP